MANDELEVEETREHNDSPSVRIPPQTRSCVEPSSADRSRSAILCPATVRIASPAGLCTVAKFYIVKCKNCRKKNRFTFAFYSSHKVPWVRPRLPPLPPPARCYTPCALVPGDAHPRAARPLAHLAHVCAPMHALRVPHHYACCEVEPNACDACEGVACDGVTSSSSASRTMGVGSTHLRSAP